MFFLAGEPDITPITNLITTWIHIGQALVGSIGALAFIFAFIWKITAGGNKFALAGQQGIPPVVGGPIGGAGARPPGGLLARSVPTRVGLRPVGPNQVQGLYPELS